VIFGDWGLGIGDWAQSPIPNPQSPNEYIMKNKFYTSHQQNIKKRQDDDEDEKPKIIGVKPELEYKNSTINFSTKFNKTKNEKNFTLKDLFVNVESTISHKSDNQVVIPKKNETTLEDMVQYTEGILNDICNSSGRLSRQLNQILDNLKKVKDQLLRLHTKKISKQKLYTKFARIANLLNVNVSELYRVGDMIDILKLSNCDFLDELIKKYSEIRQIPEKLREMLNSELNKSGLKISLIVLH
jgi:hypothetical protein